MVRILLVDEQKVIREGLKVLLESESDLEVVAAVGNGYAAIGKIEETLPDILFISVKLSETEGFDVTGIIRNKYPQVKIIVFSDRVNEQHLIQSLEMGVKGYLLKDTPFPEMVEAIYAVDKGFTHIANAAYETVIPQIAQNSSPLKIDKSEIVFSDTAKYRELSEQQSIQSASTQPQSDTISSYDVKTAHESKSSQSFLMSANNEAETNFSLPLKEEITHNNGLNRYFSLISLASLGLLAISIGVMSVIFSQRSPQVVIENAVINGKTVSINSPVKGKLIQVNYVKGASVNENSVIATVEPFFGDRYKLMTNQLQEQIELKKQQQTVAQQSLDFLESSLQTLEQELVNSSPKQLDTLFKGLHFNQIKYQETALKTAQIREDSAKTNYKSLQQMSQKNQISQPQLNSAKNSWDLAKLAIEEITISLENSRQEYKMIEEQMMGNKQQQQNQISQKITGLKQQIDSQKTSLNLFQTELNNLQDKLIIAITEATEDRSLTIKSPISGSIYNQKYREGEVVENSQAIATIIDCDNLWVEATVKPEVTTKINAQEPVLVTIADRNLSLEGKISLIESLNSDQQKNNNSSINKAIATQIPPSLPEGNYSRVVVSVSNSVDLVNKQEFCSVGQIARLSFGKEPESLISKWQSSWLSKILAYQ
jgi:DNA-binding NarL/FixJ family response regulator/multidrug resistance efflux pump